MFESLESVFQKLIKSMRIFLNATQSIRDIFFIGHGIGGAYASIAGVRWTYERYRIGNFNLWPEINLNKIACEITTFGAPRVGNSHFSKLLNRIVRYNRITHGNDHVPHFPSSSMDYKHFGVETWIEPLKNCVCPDDVNYNSYLYWDCNFSSIPVKHRRKWGDGRNYQENLNCNSGQSIRNVPDTFFHTGPYFGVTMGHCNQS
ncbi:hypothetical protein G9A89_015069 [Geosiphon pyriformis]|nr:hypothetical protein G9A89_015069 [Geosiphon pyriformis]